MKGYKGFDKDLKCKGFQYEVGKTYELDGKTELCERGFHFCRELIDVMNFYNTQKGNRFCETDTKTTMGGIHIIQLLLGWNYLNHIRRNYELV